MNKSIDAIISGYQRFRDKFFNGQNSEYDELVKFGQHPKALVIACSDSRADPAILFHCRPGDLFVVRNVANLVPPYENDNSYHGTSAALEFGVATLQVKDIIILGHSQCGGITSLFTAPWGNDRQIITKWMELAEPAFQKVRHEHPHLPLDEAVSTCCQHALVNSLKNMMTFPWISSKVEAGELNLHAWYFDLTTGLIHAYDEPLEEFSPLIMPAPAVPT